MKCLRGLSIIPLICSLSAVASAQSREDWTAKVRIGKPLYVTLLNGDRLEGVAESVTAEGLTVSTLFGARTVKFAEIRRVEKRDASWHGIVIGLGVAGAMMASDASAGAERVCAPFGGSNDCYYRDSDRAAVDAATVTFGIVAGGLIGWVVDTMVKGRSTIFYRTSAPKLSVVASPRVITGRLTISW